MTTEGEAPRKKKKKDRARESQEAPPPPPASGDPLGTRVIAATAAIVALVGVVVWATGGSSSSRSDRDDEDETEIRAADDDGDRDEDGDEDEEARPAKRPPREEPPAARPGDLPAPPDVAAPPADAQRTASGLASKVLRPGTGDQHPTATSRVTVHYTGWTTDGHMFDSSVTRGEPATFPLNRVIAGWTEGVPLMVVGERRRFWIPESLAYQGRPGAPAGMLVFDVELISIAD